MDLVTGWEDFPQCSGQQGKARNLGCSQKYFCLEHCRDLIQSILKRLETLERVR